MCKWNGFHHSINKNRKSTEFLSKLTCSWPNILSFIETCGLDNVAGHCCDGCCAHFLFHILEINKASAKWPWLESGASHEHLVACLRQLGWVESCEHLFSYVLCHNFHHQSLSSLWSLTYCSFLPPSAVPAIWETDLSLRPKYSLTIPSVSFSWAPRSQSL